MSLTFPADNLLPEVLGLIFSQSSAKAVLKAESVNKHWHKVANQPAIWQSLIRQHCPYLMAEKNAEYLKDPKALYKSEFAISAYEKYIKYNEAAINRRIDILQALLTQPGPQIPAKCKGDFLERAARAGDLSQVQALLTHAGHDIPLKAKLLAGFVSLSQDNVNLARELMTQTPYEDTQNSLAQASAQDKGNALLESISSPVHAQVIQELSKNVDIAYIILALRRAIDFNRQDYVNAILSQRGHELTPAQQIEALGTNGARDYRASKRSIARSLALERTGELNNQEDDEVQTARKRPRNR